MPETLKTVEQLLGAHKREKAKMTAEEHAALVAVRKEAGPMQTRGKTAARDVLIQKGYDFVNGVAPAVEARIKAAIENPGDPLHEMVMKQMVMRSAPVAFFEALGKQEFKSEDEGGARPNIVINISTAAVPTVKVDEAVDVPFKELP